MERKYTWAVVEKVAAECGLNPHVLDGGEFTEDQAKVLRGLWDKDNSDQSPETWEAYVRQKAIYVDKRLSHSL